jgi:hypothetical protein
MQLRVWSCEIAHDIFRYLAVWVVPFGAVNEAEFAFEDLGQHWVTGLTFCTQDSLVGAFHRATTIAADDFDEFPARVPPIQTVETSPTFAGAAM